MTALPTGRTGGIARPERPRRAKCLGGPLAGERHSVPAGAAELVIVLPVAAPPVAAVYRLARRRRQRGPAFDVLVFVGLRPTHDGEHAGYSSATPPRTGATPR